MSLHPVPTLSDIRLAFRMLTRAPAVTAIAVASIAIGVGATAVVFAAVKAVLIAPFPYSHPEELIQIRTDFSGGGNPRQDWASWSDMQDVARENRSFSALGTYHYAIFNLAGDASSLPEALYGLYVSAGMFPMLGVNPILGRNILPEETQPGRDGEMILSYGLWVRRFHADASVVGRSVQVNGHANTIIGVMPEGFDFPLAWLPLSVRHPATWIFGPPKRSTPLAYGGTRPVTELSRDCAGASRWRMRSRISPPSPTAWPAPIRAPIRAAPCTPALCAAALSDLRRPGSCC